MNPSAFPQRGPRQHCWAPRASCGGALCRVGRGNRGQPVGLWSCRWSCDYLACTLVIGKRFFQIDVDDVLEGSHMIRNTSTSSCLDVLVVDVGVVARIETGPQFCMGDLWRFEPQKWKLKYILYLYTIFHVKSEEMRSNEWQMVHQKFVPGSVASLAFSSPEPYLMLGIGGGDELGVFTVLVARLVFHKGRYSRSIDENYWKLSYWG